MKSKLPTGVVDNTFLSRLTRLDIADYLPLVFARILIPSEVKREAFKSGNRRRLRNLLSQMPYFFVDCKNDDPLVKFFLNEVLDEGEAAAIAQAEHTRSALIIDEKKGRDEAMRRDLEVFPTARILIKLKEVGSIPEIKPRLDKLRTMSSFRLKQEIYNSILREAGEME